jgi:hypothetical protein
MEVGLIAVPLVFVWQILRRRLWEDSSALEGSLLEVTCAVPTFWKTGKSLEGLLLEQKQRQSLGPLIIVVGRRSGIGVLG